MILKATYDGPFAKVQVPGFEHKVCARGESVEIRVRSGYPISGDWTITKGKKEYEAGLAEMEESGKKVAEVRASRRKAAADEATARLDRVVKAADKAEETPATSDTGPGKKGGKR